MAQFPALDNVKPVERNNGLFIVAIVIVILALFRVGTASAASYSLGYNTGWTYTFPTTTSASATQVGSTITMPSGLNGVRARVVIHGAVVTTGGTGTTKVQFGLDVNGSAVGLICGGQVTNANPTEDMDHCERTFTISGAGAQNVQVFAYSTCATCTTTIGSGASGRFGTSNTAYIGVYRDDFTFAQGDDFTAANYYTSSTIDSNFYTKTASDARYYTQAQIDSNFYTKTDSDARFALIGDSYTKPESDARYALVGSGGGGEFTIDPDGNTVQLSAENLDEFQESAQWVVYVVGFLVGICIIIWTAFMWRRPLFGKTLTE